MIMVVLYYTPILQHENISSSSWFTQDRCRRPLVRRVDQREWAKSSIYENHLLRDVEDAWNEEKRSRSPSETGLPGIAVPPGATVAFRQMFKFLPGWLGFYISFGILNQCTWVMKVYVLENGYTRYCSIYLREWPTLSAFEQHQPLSPYCRFSLSLWLRLTCTT